VTRVVTAGNISSVGSLDPDDARARIGELVGGERNGNQLLDRRDRDPVKRKRVLVPARTGPFYCVPVAHQ